jgi:CRISPR-associated endonuclease Csn1
MGSGMIYPDAAAAAGYDHARLPEGTLSPTGYLPYYGEWLQDAVLGSGDPRHTNDERWGRFPNPTVHIGMGQIRRVVNALIRKYGPPTETTVEMTRDFKLSPRKLSEIQREQAANQKKNDERRDLIEAQRQPVNGRNLLKLRLWEELNPKDPLDRRCPYSGETISIARLLSADVDIDHIIPFADCWDDSAANKVVCIAEANRAKGKQTPFEAFGASPDWEGTRLRAAALPYGKRWRFDPDARERFGDEEGFLARQLNETSWLARLARQYLSAVCNPYSIHVLPGRLTAMVRGKWGLNDLLPDHNFSDVKNRKDHRHHAIDALVAALTDRRLLYRMSNAYEEERERIVIPVPWKSFRDDLKARLDAMTVSHKPDHGFQGQLHEDTAYGVVANPKPEDSGNLVYRKGFLDLNEKEIARIRDARLRDLVSAHVRGEMAAGEDLKAALLSFSHRKDIPGLPNGIRHVRLTKTEKPEYLVTINGKDGIAYKAYSAGENAFVDIVETPDGKWNGEAVTLFQANSADGKPHWMRANPRPRFVMRVSKGDLISLDHDGKRTVMVVHRLDAAANRFKLAPHNETGNLDKRHAEDNEIDPFRWLMASYNRLKALNAERVRVDALGRIWRIRPEEAERSL